MPLQWGNEMGDIFSINAQPVVQTLNMGEHRILIIDDFLQNPAAMVDFAANSSFSAYPGQAEKKGYPGIRARAPEDYSVNITLFLEPLIKAHYGVPAELDIRKSICAFSLTTTPEQELGPLQRTPHFDASTPWHMAVLLYLCDERHGGTGFYRHNATGLQQITGDTCEHYLDVYYEEMNAKRPAQRYFHESSEQFTLLGLLPAKFNRLAVYQGSLLHTACVNPALSIDPNPRSGRLTVNTFYDF
jgi:Family of unknown function (DUF6445)